MSCLIPSRLLAAVALLATTLFGFSPSSLAARGAEPAQLNPADNPAQAASQLFTATAGGGPLSPRKVAISSFSVEYMMQNSATASATEIGRSGSANSGLYYKLVGLSDADLQALTDQLFNEFQQELGTAGFEVVPADTVRAAAAYRRLAAGGKPSPMDKSENRSEYRVVAPTGMALWGMSAASGGLLAGFTGAAQVLGSLGDSIELQKELGATLLSVQLRLDFATLSSSNSSLLGRISGSAEVKGKVQPALTTALMNWQSATSGGAVSLKQPLILQGDAIGEVRDVSSTATNVGLALLNLAIGKGGSSSVMEMEAVAEPAVYREVVGKNLSAVRAMMITTLASSR